MHFFATVMVALGSIFSSVWIVVASEKTLGIIQVVAALGIPFVLTYTATIYWVFRGKVKVTPASY